MHKRVIELAERLRSHRSAVLKRLEQQRRQHSVKNNKKVLISVTVTVYRVRLVVGSRDDLSDGLLRLGCISFRRISGRGQNVLGLVEDGGKSVLLQNEVLN